MNEITLTSESKIRHPVHLFKEMMNDLAASHELARRMVIRNIRGQYRQTLLGMFWAFVPALGTATLFILLQKGRVIRVGPTDLPYAVYVIFGIMLWQTFVEALNGPITGVIAERAMISKQCVAPESILLAKLGEIIFNFAVRSPVLIAVLIWFEIPIQWTSVFFVPALLSLISLGFGLGMLLSPLNVLFQDVSKALNVVTGLWMFLTPIVYPRPREGFFAFLVQLNPVTPLLVTLRELVTRPDLTQLPQFIFVSILSALGIFVTWIIFRLSMPFMVERMN